MYLLDSELLRNVSLNNISRKLNGYLQVSKDATCRSRMFVREVFSLFVILDGAYSNVDVSIAGQLFHAEVMVVFEICKNQSVREVGAQ